MKTLHRISYKTNLENQIIEFVIYYDNSKKTYWVSATPVKISKLDNGLSIREFAAMTGFRDNLLTIETRQSDKYLKVAIQKLESNITKYLEWFKNKGYELEK